MWAAAAAAAARRPRPPWAMPSPSSALQRTAAAGSGGKQQGGAARRHPRKQQGSTRRSPSPSPSPKTGTRTISRRSSSSLGRARSQSPAYPSAQTTGGGDGHGKTRPPAQKPPGAGEGVLSLLSLLSRFGRHSCYGNGLPRPYMRGWLHTVTCILGVYTVCVACTHTCVGSLQFSCEDADFLGCDASSKATASTQPHWLLTNLITQLRRRNGSGLLFVQWTLLGYAGSLHFHMMPYASQRHYNLALGGDLLGVALGSLAPHVVWSRCEDPHEHDGGPGWRTRCLVHLPACLSLLVNAVCQSFE
jgi:hypothetical protein